MGTHAMSLAEALRLAGQATQLSVGTVRVSDLPSNKRKKKKRHKKGGHAAKD